MADDDGKPSNKPVVRGKGKGKALNAIAAASGRDPAQIVKSVNEAEAAAKAAAARIKAEEAAARLRAEEDARRAREEVTAAQIFSSLTAEERYRFECFRRCGFASGPMDRFVARVLVEEAERRYLARRGAAVGLGGTTSGGIASVDHDAPSSNMAAVTDTSDGDSSSKKQNAQRKRKKQSKKHMLFPIRSYPYPLSSTPSCTSSSGICCTPAPCSTFSTICC